MINLIKQKIITDLKEINNDDESDKFSYGVNNMMKILRVKPEKRKMILKHLERYSKVCKKDKKMRISQVVNNSISFVEQKKKENNVFTPKEIKMLNIVDFYDIENRYGSYASSLYLNMNYDQQKRMIEVLDKIENMNISSEQKELRKRNYLFVCSGAKKKNKSQ